MKNSDSSAVAQKKLKPHRRKIDLADRTLLQALARRFLSVIEIGKIKKSLKLPALQNARWKEVMRERLKISRKLGLNPRFIDQLYQLIHHESLRIQKSRTQTKKNKNQKKNQKLKKRSA